MRDPQNLFIFERENIIEKVWKVFKMMTRIIVYLLMMSLLAIAALPTGTGQISATSSPESNATVAKADSAYVDPPENLFHIMEILGPWKVEFNSTEMLSTEEYHFDMAENEELLGMSMEGLDVWAMALIDSMDHEVALLWITESNRAAVTNEETLDGLMESILSMYDVDASTKSAIDIDGNKARKAVGFSTMYNRSIQAFAYSYEPYFDTFYNQNVSKSLIYGIDFRDVNEYNGLIESLHVENLY